LLTSPALLLTDCNFFTMSACHRWPAPPP
jgi:hypothetical protein